MVVMQLLVKPTHQKHATFTASKLLVQFNPYLLCQEHQKEQLCAP